MLSRTLIKKQPGRRWLKYIAALGLLVATLVIAGIALAVHDLKFQLDGDVTASTLTHVGPPGSTQSLDWDSFFLVRRQEPSAAGRLAPGLHGLGLHEGLRDRGQQEGRDGLQHA